MKILVLLGIGTLLTVTVLAQSREMRFYFPDGTAYKRVCTSIVDINADFDKDGRIKTFSPLCLDSGKYDCFIVIGYKLFTDRALWVFTNSEEKIETLVESFNYQEYLGSSDFYYDVKDHIDKGTLTEKFILETLGSPDQIDGDGEATRSIKTWTYLEPRIVLTLDSGLVTDFQRIGDLPEH